MAYLKFPIELTEEELMLKASYAKLKKKKKALQDFKTSIAEAKRGQQATKTKGSSEARAAREVAQKLIKSGVIAAIKTPKRPEESFKRPLGLERKLNSTEKTVNPSSTVSSYQPFSAIQPENVEPEVKKPKFEPKLKKLSESFVPATDPADKIVEKPVQKPKPKPSKGNTIFVYGQKLSEEFVREHFATFGNIVHVAMEKEKKSFITFEKLESAEEAIKQMDGKEIASIELQVSMARRQFTFNPVNDNSSSSMWVSAATGFDRRKPHRDKRDLQTYDDNTFD